MSTPSNSPSNRPYNSDRFQEEIDDSGCLDHQHDHLSGLQHDPRDLNQSQPSPVVRLLRITEQGLVFESWRNFEVGIFIDFGMHVPRRAATAGTAGNRDHKPSFLNLEGFVVDCQAVCCSEGQPHCRNASFQVSVMFSDLDATDRALLRELEACVHPQPKPPAPATSISRDMLMAQLEEVFGLN